MNEITQAHEAFKLKPLEGVALRIEGYLDYFKDRARLNPFIKSKPVSVTNKEPEQYTFDFGDDNG